MKPGIDLLSRRGLLASAGAAVAFRNIPAASAQTSPKETNLRKSAFVLIGDGGSLRAPDLARRRLFETSGEPIANGSVTVDGRSLSSTGTERHAWSTPDGKIEATFRFPDSKSTFALTPMP